MTDNLIAFLTARLAEDENYANISLAVERQPGRELTRMIREVESKRRIVDLFDQASRLDGTSLGIATLRLVARSLAEVYVDHPDYRQEWTP